MRKFFTILLFCFSNIIMGQTNRFYVGLGGFVMHSFPDSKVAENANILGYSDVTSKTLLLEPGYELNVGAKIINHLELFAGINSIVKHIESSPFYYELTFQQINYPLLIRYNFSYAEDHSDFVIIGLSFGKILQRELSRDRSIWQHSYLEDWNNISPLSLKLGLGRKYKITEKSNLVLASDLSCELSDNEIIRNFYAPFSLGLKIMYEFSF